MSAAAGSRDETRASRRAITAAYVTTGDAADVRTWSGIFYYAAQALAAQSIVVDRFGPLQTRYNKLFRAKSGIYRFLLGRRHHRDREPVVARHYARQVMSRLGPEHDVVFGVGTIPLGYLECEQPIIAWSDATFAAMIDFYSIFTNLSAATIRNAQALERAALRRCRFVIYSSDWAAESAITDYGIDRGRVAVVPFGANLGSELSYTEAEAAIDARTEGACQLLFIGKEWERKGGPRAVEIAAALNAAGLPTRLDVVGSWPGRVKPPPFVNLLGLVDKSLPEGYETLRSLLTRSHFLVLPARADCTPIVVSEAAAHALPTLATNVGGIPTVVRDGVNGKLFEPDADAAEYAAYVLDVLSSTSRYRELALSSLDEYRRRLNWRAAGASVRRLIEEALESP
jgi:glycosyltransferase involved in cell wall biosynthesis